MFATGASHANSEIIMPTPSSIILGMHVEEENELRMVEYCESSAITLKKVQQRRDSFRLEIVPYSE